VVTAPARREVVRERVTGRLGGRCTMTVAHERATLLNVPQPDPDPSLRDRIVAFAQRHRRQGGGMIYLKLRHDGRVINHKRVDRLYANARTTVGGTSADHSAA
jgi:putative transposase